VTECRQRLFSPVARCVAAQQRFYVLSDDALPFRQALGKPSRASGQVDEEAQTGSGHPDIFPRRWCLPDRNLRLTAGWRSVHQSSLSAP
jgi:hypothetical protein